MPTGIPSGRARSRPCVSSAQRHHQQDVGDRPGDSSASAAGRWPRDAARSSRRRVLDRVVEGSRRRTSSTDPGHAPDQERTSSPAVCGAAGCWRSRRATGGRWSASGVERGTALAGRPRTASPDAGPRRRAARSAAPGSAAGRARAGRRSSASSLGTSAPMPRGAARRRSAAGSPSAARRGRSHRYLAPAPGRGSVRRIGQGRSAAPGRLAARP